MDTNNHECRREVSHGWARIDVARAFQPEICSAAAVPSGNFADRWSHAKPRGREGRCVAAAVFSPRM